MISDFKQLLKGSQHFTSLQATTFQNLWGFKKQIFLRNASIWIKYSIWPSVSLEITSWCLRELRGRHTSPTNKREDLHGATVFRLLQLPVHHKKPKQHVWIIQIKTPPTVKLLQDTWTCLKGSGPCLFFFSMSSTTAYTVLWCVWVLRLLSETYNMRWVWCDLYRYHSYVHDHG